MNRGNSGAFIALPFRYGRSIMYPLPGVDTLWMIGILTIPDYEQLTSTNYRLFSGAQFTLSIDPTEWAISTYMIVQFDVKARGRAACGVRNGT